MKNLKLKLKLAISFGIIIVLMAIVGIVGAVGLLSLSSADTDLYNNHVVAMDALSSIRVNYSLQRGIYRNFIIYDAQTEYFQAAQNNLTALELEMEKYIADHEALVIEDDIKQAFNKFVSYYRGDYKKLKEQVLSLGRANMTDDAKAMLSDSVIQKLSDDIDACLNECYDYNVFYSKSTVDNNISTVQRLITILLIVFASACLLAIFLTIYISTMMCKPLDLMTNYLQSVGNTGDLALRPQDEAAIAKYSATQDEMGIFVKSLSAFVMRIINVSSELEHISGGDLSREVRLLSDKDTIGVSFDRMIDSLNKMFKSINNAAGQVSTGSKQVADGAQTLAQGSTEQAATIVQLSDTVSDVAAKTRENATRAQHAAQLTEEIKKNAQKGSVQMDQLLGAVQDIQQASNSIGKVIKVIDDIAFQTNILALNAAVEAARAGQHGKGFAVVAEEVRNLAAKSAEAAKETESLIANSIEKAGLGVQNASETAESLSQIVVGINESGVIASEIAQSSLEGAATIQQLNSGIDQVAQVVQQNSATSQESAATAEEMSQQANTLEELVAQFKLSDHNIIKS